MSRFQRSRDPAVFEELHRATQAELRAWIGWLGRALSGSIDVEEVLQEVYISVFRYAESYDGGRGGGFRSWSRTIAANVLKRTLQRRAERVGCGEMGRFGPLPERCDPRPGPHIRLVEGEEGAALVQAWPLFLLAYAAAFQRLSPRDRRALELVEVEGLTYAEAAANLRVGPSNMKMIVLRARRRLMAMLERALARNASEAPRAWARPEPRAAPALMTGT
jgi:RNA polymerase sigma-70 factor (ECF subfamily)